MSIAITELMKACKPGVGMPCGLAMDMACAGYGQILLDKGFYFLLVTNGTASVSDVHTSYTLASRHLLVVTPRRRVTLAAMSVDFRMVCLYIEPDYFDTLSVGQLVYGQVSQFVGNYLLPIFQLEAEQADYLQKTLVLFSSRLEELHLYRDGIVRHLCSFLLLQMADALYQKNRETTGFANRSTEIFRNFKRLLVHHYREQHNIGFYADRLYISTTYLSRIVRNITGHTVCFHISELLCADARKLLECTDKDVKEIADELGFSDQSVFGKFFVRKTGLSPLKYRMRRGEVSK